VVEATPEERAALAKDFKLPAIHALEGRFRLTGTPRRVHVAGGVRARVEQTCVVTLEPVVNQVSESVDLMFSEDVPASEGQGDEAVQLGEREPPEPIVNGRIDLGAVTAEFLALGLDPYPRKPGVAYEPAPERDPAASPFAALAKMKKP
jgi:uncharacterized metal-binding protein YceD (DUF177 family)